MVNLLAEFPALAYAPTLLLVQRSTSCFKALCSIIKWYSLRNVGLGLDVRSIVPLSAVNAVSDSWWAVGSETFLPELGLLIHMTNKRRIYYPTPAMPVRSCKVTIEDLNGVRCTIEVTAASLYEAVALGMAAIRGNEWVTGIARGLNPVKVRVMDVAVEHEVKLGDFTKWLDRDGSSPRDMTERKRIRSILGMQKSNS